MHEYFLEDAESISPMASSAHPLNGQGLMIDFNYEAGALPTGSNF